MVGLAGFETVKWALWGIFVIPVSRKNKDLCNGDDRHARSATDISTDVLVCMNTHQFVGNGAVGGVKAEVYLASVVVSRTLLILPSKFA